MWDKGGKLNEGENMKITVIHKAMRDETPTAVALVNVPTEITDMEDALEYAYRWTNNIGGSWSMKIGPDANNNVELLAPLHWSEKRQAHMGLRSTMTFDEMIVDGKTFKVDSFGFEEVI